MESENNPPNEPGLVTVFRLAGGGTEEMEVLTVRQLLESNGINTVLVGDSPMPNLSEEIRVAEEDAERLISQARGLLIPAEEGIGFARAYFEIMQRDAAAVLAHRDMLQIITSLRSEPRP